MGAVTACKGNSDPKAANIEKRCEQLGRVCGDKDKHDQKIIDGCKAAATKQVEKGCTDQAAAVYDCYEKELCGGDEKVWALDDLRVLADRHKKCETERAALRECVDKKTVDKKAEGSAR
jgi:hypothetical protein